MDTWAALAARLDPATRRPVLMEGVEVAREPLAGGGEQVLLRHPTELTYTVLSGEEADLLPALDGRRPLAELPLETAPLVGLLDEAHLLADRPATDVWASVERAITRPDRAAARIGRAMRDLEVEWRNAEPLITFLYRYLLRPAFTPAGAMLGVLLVVAGAVAFGVLVSRQEFTLTVQSAGWGLGLLLAMELVIVAIHELGHAAVLVHHQRRVRGAGFRIYFGAPAFYIESSDALMLPRGRRIFQAAAGPWFEAVAIGSLAIALVAFPAMPASDVVWRFLALNYAALFLNLIPLLELDGYWILSDSLRIPDLRPRSLAFVRGEMWRKLWRRESWQRSEVGLALYGTVGVAFTVLCLVTSVFFWERTFGGFVRSLWDAGLAGRAGLVVLAILVGGPLIRAGVRLVNAVLRSGREALRRARFRLQRKWRVDAAHLLDALPLFEGLPVEVLNEVSGRMQLRHHSRGTLVVRQGERADALYVVRRGAAEVLEEDPATGEARVIRKLGPGDGFGEAGLLDGAPRTASVRAVRRMETVAINRGTFERLLSEKVAGRPGYALSMGEADRLRSIATFAHLSTGELLDLAAAGSWRNVEPGRNVVRQGDEAAHFYAIESGRLEVIEDGAVRRTLGPGDHFGEIGLLSGGLRTATVRAMTPARVFEVEAGAFGTFVATAFRAGRLRPHIEASRPRTG